LGCVVGCLGGLFVTPVVVPAGCVSVDLHPIWYAPSILRLSPQQVALRCRIVLAAAAGESDVTIAKRLSVNRNTVILWRKRFGDEGLDGLWDIAPGRGRKPVFQIDKIAAIVDATLQTKPAGMTHWSCRTMAFNQGVSKSTVNNIWRAHNLQPHRTETFRHWIGPSRGCRSRRGGAAR
jgi:hypothetical protein